jgi:3-oxoacid CoA-transferase subunit A
MITNSQKCRFVCEIVVCKFKEKTFFVYYEKGFPKIRYFVDGETYNLQGYKTLVIGGAYSVDKYYRLQNGAKWFENELLTEDEMNEIEKKIIGQQFDFILTHTCPISWEPTDLFLSCINQSTVDKSMEIWMDRIKDKIKWQIWCFGHFHADRLERPHVEMFFRDTELLENVWQRWEKYRETGELDYWLDKSPNFYMYEVD